MTLGALMLALTGAGCAAGNEVSSSPSSIQAWVTGAQAGSALVTLRVDAANVTHVIATHDSAAALRTACALLTTDAQTAIGNLPAPDPALTQTLNRTYSVAAAAGTECFQGQSARSAASRRQIPGLVASALATIQRMTGHVPNTSTTMPPPGGDPFAG